MFVAHYDGDAETAIKQVNQEVANPTACVVATTAYLRGPDIASCKNQGLGLSDCEDHRFWRCHRGRSRGDKTHGLLLAVQDRLKSRSDEGDRGSQPIASNKATRRQCNSNPRHAILPRQHLR